MPHILAHGIDMDKTMQKLYIHAEVTFSKEYYRSNAAKRKIEELQLKIEALVSEYYDNVESDEIENYMWPGQSLERISKHL